jgi:hypothetical protein
MWRTLLMAWTAAMAATACGCSSGPLTTGPLLDNPIFLTPDPSVTVENPVYVPLGPAAYNTVFEKVLDTVSDYFEIAETNRYDGSIKTFPKTSPGLERYLLPGDPDLEQRLYATLQSIRYYALVRIQVADDGGFFVDVKIFKELEDVPRPSRSTAGAAVFRSDNVVERQFQVIDVAPPQSGGWIPIGRDCKLEQVILQRIKKCL